MSNKNDSMELNYQAKTKIPGYGRVNSAELIGDVNAIVGDDSREARSAIFGFSNRLKPTLED